MSDPLGFNPVTEITQPFTFGPGAGAGANGTLPGATQFEYGFSIPTGDPGAIRSASVAVKLLGEGFHDQSQTLRSAADLATGAGREWSGAAADAFVAYSARMVSHIDANAAPCAQAAAALDRLADALAQAQAQTLDALRRCKQYAAAVGTARGDAEAAARDEVSATQSKSLAPPHEATHWDKAISDARGRASDAASAERTAQGELDAAKLDGARADHAYETELTACMGQISSAGGDLVPVPVIEGHAPSPIPDVGMQGRAAAALLAAGRGDLPEIRPGDPITAAALQKIIHGHDLSPAEAEALIRDVRAREVQMANAHHSFWHDLVHGLGDAGKFVLDHPVIIDGVVCAVVIVVPVSAPIAASMIGADGAFDEGSLVYRRDTHQITEAQFKSGTDLNVLMTLTGGAATFGAAKVADVAVDVDKTRAADQAYRSAIADGASSSDARTISVKVYRATDGPGGVWTKTNITRAVSGGANSLSAVSVGVQQTGNANSGGPSPAHAGAHEPRR